MPYVKPISGHGTTVKLMRYLTKEGRALAADYLNLTYDSRLQPGVDLPVDYNWSKDMDEFRRARGGDDPWKGKQARTFKHYIVSPDPKDNISIEQLRQLSVDWASENFGDYQVAIVYHDDNEAGIPHAHVVVNNMNVGEVRRLQDPNPSELNRRLQSMAAARGLSGLGIADGRNAFQRRADSPKSPMNRPATRQRVYVRKAEKEIAEKGEYSWVSDIRSRVSTARSLAMDERDFMSILAELGVEVSDNSSRNARRDWIYSIADHPTWRITGERMGLAFGKSSIQARFLMTDRASPEARNRIEEIAKTAIELADVAELEELAFSLEVNERYQIDSMEDYGHIIDELERSGSDDVEQVRAARSFCSRKGILPQRGSQRRIYSHGSSRTSMSWSDEEASGRSDEPSRERAEPQRTFREER